MQKLSDQGLSPKGYTLEIVSAKESISCCFSHTGDRRHALLRTDVAECVVQNKRVSTKCVSSPPLSGGMAVPTLAFPCTFWELINLMMLQLLCIEGIHQPEYAQSLCKMTSQNSELRTQRLSAAETVNTRQQAPSAVCVCGAFPFPEEYIEIP